MWSRYRKYYLIGVTDIVVCERITTGAGEVSKYYQTDRARQNVNRTICRYIE